ncbi:beta-N-acetylhexosaminidase [bacteria symbiont BFo1 of Frankliniella occidentalis]|jgi:hexosaminidase|nr:beta-N-acetylhexosaminidase [bacteria symbiont BFo1 of Frankliniella occidentalis]KYP86681.1 beta-N-acetylhexosaminidase [bacteria symbiont BFo1 of Frankliniella occidentalis]KYP92127.1 beta-N-acetylhexosaminidase [bacteria symbiont BFo1 of Frankliniella occidentalis]PIJ58306.1 beta-N-acetylhexosaminidase [Erwinia sp. OLMDLW33]
MPWSLPRALLVCSLFLPFSVLSAPAGDLPLMPWPQQVEQPQDGGSLALTTPLEVKVSGDDLSEALPRWQLRLARQTGNPRLPVSSSATTLKITIARKVAPTPQPDSDESYRLTVNGAGIQLDAETRFGAMRGMETLLQLVHNGALPLVTINDRPRFPWRGILIDSARHFLPIETLKRQIDGIAAAKMNVFHWHLTDDQGWRFASSHYPQLQEKASDGLWYSQQQMRDIVSYASERGVRVVPEIDFPGHASALAVAMPQLISAPGPYQMERGWGVFKPLLDPSNEQVYQFIDTLVGEVAAIFPDPYIHIGGDEVDASQWNSSEAIRQFMQQQGLKDAHALQAYFNQRVEKILEKHRRQMVGWDEIYHPDLPRSIVIQSWQGPDALGEVAKNDYRGILSTGFYLDQAQPASYHYRNEVWPQGLEGADRLQDKEVAQSWQFTLPRLKGKPLSGSFTLIDAVGGWRGFIDFDGRSRRMVRDVRWLAPNQFTFRVDSWMGELQPTLSVTGDKISGYWRIGNVRYPTAGTRLAQTPPGIAPPVPDEAQLRNNLLGGEAALWAEMVDESVIDVRLWPRAFVVGERLWSAQDVNNVQNMYRRLAAVDSWSVVSVGLQQHAQAQLQMTRLANSSDIIPLQIFAEALEPAQWYTRQHLKYQAGHYTLAEPFNRLADILPAESDKVRELDHQVDALIVNRGDRQALQAIRHQLRAWQQNIPQVEPLLAQNPQLRPLLPVAGQVAAISQMGLSLLDAMESERTFGAREVAKMHQLLDQAALTQDEVVIALVYPIEKLLRYGK